MTKVKTTRAQQLARHRKVFLLAREHGVTLAEAEQLLAREEWRHQQDRLARVQRCGRSVENDPARLRAAVRGDTRPIPDDAPWMMRD